MKLGNVLDTAGLTKSNFKEAAKLGAGAAAFPFVYGFIQSSLLKMWPSTFAQGSYPELATRAILGVSLGHVAGKFAKMPAVGDGMAASAVGSAVKDLIAPMFSPSAAAVQNAVQATEAATGQQQMSGVAPLARGLAGFRGLGRTPADAAALFGVGGTNSPAARRMLNGATVAIENTTPGGLNGATVAIENTRPATSGMSGTRRLGSFLT